MASTNNDVPMNPQINLNYYLNKYMSDDDFTENSITIDEHRLTIL